ncbi:MAG: serine/threonine-protein kinase [Egibacteraceae bacterium]
MPVPPDDASRPPADGHGTVAAAITADTILGERYHLETVVGRGGMADVYRARDLVLERAVAVKVVRGAGDDDTRRFTREIRAMAALSHPGIVQLFDAGTHQGSPYLVMELIEGTDLPSTLAAGPMDATRTATLGQELARALAHAHGIGIVHRDVKPANVLLGADGRSLLSDFGIARLTEATRLTSPGMTAGTAGYLAPEQLEAADVGPAADVYALGLVLLEALTGRKEFTGTAVEAAMARLQRDPVVPDDLPAPWPGLLAAMTARDPAPRPSATEVATWLSTGQAPADSGQPADATADATAEQTMTLPRRPPATTAAPAAGSGPGRRAVAGVVALLVIAAALVAVVLANPGGTPGQDSPPPPAAEGTLPAELDEAMRRLEESVRP